MSRKIQSALEDGKPTVYWFQGNVYSRIPGERDRLLFTYQAFNIRASKALVEPGRGYGFRHVSREILLYLDPKTKEVIRTWKNPWTGKDVEVVHVANDPVNSRGTFAQGPAGPFRLDATFKEGLGIYQVEVPLWYTNPLGGEYQQYVGGDYQCIELFTFYFNEKQMLDSTITDAPDINVAWSRVSQFLPWMEMGGRVGYMVFSGAGKKVAGFDALPDVLKNEVAARYPEYQDAAGAGRRAAERDVVDLLQEGHRQEEGPAASEVVRPQGLVRPGSSGPGVTLSRALPSAHRGAGPPAPRCSRCACTPGTPPARCADGSPSAR